MSMIELKLLCANFLWVEVNAIAMLSETDAQRGLLTVSEGVVNVKVDNGSEEPFFIVGLRGRSYFGHTILKKGVLL